MDFKNVLISVPNRSRTRRIEKNDIHDLFININPTIDKKHVKKVKQRSKESNQEFPRVNHRNKIKIVIYEVNHIDTDKDGITSLFISIYKTKLSVSVI